jgi:hypothetical protein
MMEAVGSSERSVLIRATWRNIPEDSILQVIFTFNTHILLQAFECMDGFGTNCERISF